MTGRGFSRQIGTTSMMFMAVSSVVGSGWLFASLYAAQIAGPAAIFSWLIGGAITLVIGFVYAELGGALPVPGGLARIPFFTHGAMAGFMAGWLCWVSYVATAPIEVAAVLDYATNYVPWLSRTAHDERVLTASGLAVAAVLVFAFTGANMLAVKWFAKSNAVITVWKLVVPVGASIALIAAGFRTENFTEFGGFAPGGIEGVLAAVSGGGVMFSLFGFRTVIDMAGEAKNPQRTVPLAMIGAIFICIALYMLLQITFIGVIPAPHVQQGWSAIAENVPGGPFAAFAALLGLQWVAIALYVDAVVSPSGTALAFAGATARINYALSRNGQAPPVFQRLNRNNVPAWSLVFNAAAGMILFLPFPGWADLVGYISSSVVLSIAFGPVALVALRHQIPELKRPFRVPCGVAVAAMSFVFVGFVVYWTGWDINWKVFSLILLGLVIVAASRHWRWDEGRPLDARGAAWLWPYVIGLALISYFGNYGGGLGLIPPWWDLAIVTVFSLIVFWFASRLCLSAEQARQHLAADKADLVGIEIAGTADVM